MPKRLQNRLRLGYPLGTPKNTIFDVQTSPRWLPKISDFFKNRLKILAMTVFGPRCLLEASKSLPRACREPPKSRPRALKKPSIAFKSLLLGPQEDSKSLLCDFWVQICSFLGLTKNRSQMIEFNLFFDYFWTNLRNCKFGPKIRIWRCCPEMVEKCIKFDRLGPGFGQT